MIISTGGGNVDGSKLTTWYTLYLNILVFHIILLQIINGVFDKHGFTDMFSVMLG